MEYSETSILKLWITLILLLIITYTGQTFSEPVLLNEINHPPIQLESHYQLFVDYKDNVTIDDILAPNSQILFSDLPDGKANLGYHKETHWFKVDISNNSPHQLKELLEFNYPLLNQIGVYIVNKNSKRILARYDSGDTRPFHTRLYQHPNFIFPLSLPAQSDITLYFRIKSLGSITANATLWQPDIFPEHARLQFFFITLYFGLLIGLICYNFLLFLSIKETSYLFYVLFAISMLMAAGSFHGIWFELLWPDKPQWHNLSVPTFFSLAGMFAALFSQSILQTKIYTPLLHTVFNIIALCFGILLFVFYYDLDLPIAQILTTLAILLTLTALIAGSYLSFKKIALAQTYLFAWFVLFIGTLLFAARNFGWLPDTLITRYGLMFGNALEMILLSFSLAQRINTLKHSSHQSRQETMQAENKLIEVLRNSERELLKRVKKRTEELENANKKLLIQEEELKQLAHFDALTGLANRTLINQQLTLLLAHCKRENIKLAVLFLDLDGFKAVNDQYGHKVGDELLRIVAQKIQKTLRDSDLVGRLGGDEFIVIIQAYSDEFDPQHVAEKIKKALSKRIIIDGFTIEIGVSIGIAIYPDDGLTIDTLLSVSDTAMYRDKQLRKTGLASG